MNYVDVSNFKLYLLDLVYKQEFLQIESTLHFPKGVSSLQQDLTFGAFKGRDWKDKVFDLV